jgi:hypothetical protein
MVWFSNWATISWRKSVISKLLLLLVDVVMAVPVVE